MRSRLGFFGLLGVLALVGCSPTARGPLAQLPEHNTPAFVEAARRHAPELQAWASADDAGLWVVEDSLGHLVASGVLATFPTTISSSDYETVVPGALGLEARAFGFARTPSSRSQPAFRVAYVTLGGRS